MENNNKTNAARKNKKGSVMKKIGKSIKDTFIEMSSSLAGWIDDTGTQFSGKNKTTKKNSKSASTTQNKSSTQSNK